MPRGVGYDPMGEWQGPLPIPPRDPAAISGGEVPLGNAERGGAGPAFQAASPNAERMARLQRTLDNPLYRFGSALAGTNPAAEEMRGLQQMDLQQQQFALQQRQMEQQVQQFLLTKKVAVGNMAVQFLEKVASARPEQRQTMIELGGAFLVPLLREAGYNLPQNLLVKMADTPGLATQFGALIADTFQDEASQKQILGEVAAVEPKDVPKYVADRWKQAQEAALPRVQQALVRAAQHVRSDPGRMSRLGLLDKDGKPQPIPAEYLMGAVDQMFRTGAEKAMALRVLSGEGEHGKFLANLRITPGALAEEQLRILGVAQATAETPKGAAELRTAEATATKAEAEAGVAGRRASAEVKKLEAEAGTAAEAARVALSEAKLRVTKLQQETTGGTEQDKRGQAEKARTAYLGMASVRAMQLAQATYGQLKEVADRDASPAGDYAIIVNFAKLLDPDTAAREGEQAAVQSAVARDSKFKEWYDLLIGGKKLTGEQRKDIMARATDVLNGRVKAFEPVAQQFRDFAKRNGLNPADVVVEFGDVIQSAKEGKSVPKITGTPQPVP